MSQDPPPYDAPDAGADNMPSVGELLIAARERWNYSAADMARQLRLALRQVEALEANRFEALPGNTFVRGFIRNYAKAVQEDPEALLEVYESMGPHAVTPQAATQPERIEFNQKPTPKWVWWAAILLVFALAMPLGVYFVLHDEEPGGKTRLSSSSAGLPQATPAPEIPPALAPPAETQGAAMGAVSGVAASADSGQPASDLMGNKPLLSEATSNAAVPSNSQTLSSPSSVTATAPAGSAVAPSVKTLNATTELSFKFDGDAWVEVRDKQGKKIFSQLNRAGTEQTLSPSGPVSLVVGNAAQVRIAYNGKPVDLTPYIRVNVARLTLE